MASVVSPRSLSLHMQSLDETPHRLAPELWEAGVNTCTKSHVVMLTSFGGDKDIWHILQEGEGDIKTSSMSIMVNSPTLSSQRSGRCRRISRGSASAAITMNSARPRFKALVAEGSEKYLLIQRRGSQNRTLVLRP